MKTTVLGIVFAIATVAGTTELATLLRTMYAAELNVSRSSNRLLAAAAMPQTHSPGERTVTMYWFCEVDSMGAPPLNSYFSSIFEAPDQNATTMRNAFASYVLGKYSQKGNPSCEAFPDQAATEKGLKEQETVLSDAQNKHKVVEVPWTYSTGGSAGAAANTPPSGSSNPSTAAPGRLFYHVCEAGGATRTEGAGMQTRSIPMPFYISDIYPVPMDKSINNADGIAFAQFLGSKYDPYFSKGNAMCGGNFTDMAAEQAAKQKQEETYRNNARVLPSRFPNPNVIETGWKWVGTQ